MQAYAGYNEQSYHTEEEYYSGDSYDSNFQMRPNQFTATFPITKHHNPGHGREYEAGREVCLSENWYEKEKPHKPSWSNSSDSSSYYSHEQYQHHDSYNHSNGGIPHKGGHGGRFGGGFGGGHGGGFGGGHGGGFGGGHGGGYGGGHGGGFGGGGHKSEAMKYQGGRQCPPMNGSAQYWNFKGIDD